MKKNQIIIIAIIAIVVIVGIIFIVNKKDGSDTEQEKDTTNIGSNTETNTDIVDVNNISDKVNVTVAKVSGGPGSIVTVPVSFDTIVEKGVGGCNFSIEYDNTKVEVEEVIPGDIIGSNISNLEYALSDSKGMISFLFACDNESDAITKSGIFANVKFLIKENLEPGDVALTFTADRSVGDAGLERVDAVYQDGQISIK